MCVGELMSDEDQVAILFAKYEEFDRKARTETLPGVRRAYETVAREFLEQARAIDPDYVAARASAASR